MYYNTHYTMANQMLNNTAAFAVFQNLVDRLTEDKPEGDVVSVSLSNVSKATCVYRQTIKKILQQLEVTGLVSVLPSETSKSRVKIHVARYVALMSAYMNLPKHQVDEFSSALWAGDNDKLKDLGVDEKSSMRDEFFGMKGRFLPFTSNKAENQKTDEKSSTFGGGMVKVDEISSTLQKLMKNHQLLKTDEISSTLAAVYSIIDEISSTFQNLAQKTDEISSTFSDEDLMLMIFHHKKLFAAHPEVKELYDSVIFDAISSEKCSSAIKKLMIFHHQPDEISSTLGDSIYNIIKKENSQSEALFIKEREGDFELSDEELEAGWKKTQEAMDKHRQRAKKKANLPYFRQDKILDFIEGRDLDRPDKIFINKLFAICHDHFDMDEQRDEDGNVVYEACHDVNNMAIPREDIKADYLLRALDETIEACNTQGIEINEDISADLELIVDWKTQVLGDGEYYIIDTTRLKDVYAEEIPVVSEKHVRGDVQGREEDREYMHQVILMGDSDELWKQLTPVELSVYNFLSVHFRIDQDGYIEEPKSDFATKSEMDKFWCTGIHPDISRDDFFEVVFNYRADKYETLTLRPRMFDSRKIRRWNVMHGFESKIQ